MAKVEATIRTQIDLHHRISRVVENMKKLGKEKITPLTINSRLEAVETYWKVFQVSHTALIGAQTEELKSHDYYANDFYAVCEDAYFSSKDELLLFRQQLTAESISAPSGQLDMTNVSRNIGTRALPKIQLPKFAGDYNSWPTFRDLFTSMIVDNDDIAAVEKLHYLKNNVSGEAAKRISNFGITADNFTRAWNALIAWYENQLVLVNSYFEHLFKVQPLSRKSADDLKDLIATVKETLGVLQPLGSQAELWDYFIVYFVAQRLDADSREAWELHQGSSTKPAQFIQLEEFLDGRIRALEMVAPRPDKQARSSKSVVTSKAARVHAANTNINNKCLFCNETHYISRCSEFSGKSLAERREFVNTKRLCYNCLGPHKVNECRTVKRCRVCNGQHHTLLHNSGANSGINSNAPSNSTASGASPPAVHATPAHANNTLINSRTSQSQTLLATAQVLIISAQGHRIFARALLDQGSELSFVRESLAQLLRLPRQHATVPILGIGSRPAGSTRGALSIQILSRVDPSVEIEILAHILPQLTGRIPAVPLANASWKHISDLPLANPNFALPNKIDLILGADVYGRLLRDSIRRGGTHEPITQDTVLGWIISGPTSETTIAVSNATPPSKTLTGFPDCELNELICKFWTQEEVPSSKAIQLNADEEQCERHFTDTYSRDPTGRYIVRLPFRTPTPVLGSSRNAAYRMLFKLQRRLTSDSTFSRLYIDFLQEYETLTHMSRISDSQASSDSAYFLPHHGVLREGSTTTKLRVVFNGSSRTTSGVSLNDCLHIGPKLQNDMFDIILNWRSYAYVFSADIEKMYRQITVHPDDRQYQQILWSVVGEPAEFQLNTVTYGLVCAPYLALRVLRQLACDEGSRFPEAAGIVLTEMYVDDVLSGADTLSNARAKVLQIDQLLKAGGFTLHKWTSNEQSILSDINSHRYANTTPREFQSELFARALGLAWNPSDDVFVLQPSVAASPSIITKRSILSRVAQLFDPLGWILPITIAAKIFIQDLWKLKVDWDEPLAEGPTARWRNFENALSCTSIQIPRWLGFSASSSIEFHGFSDASQQAIGAVIYVRVPDNCGTMRIHLVAAKSKVAPLKRTTIPRLELAAAVLLSRLLTRVQSALKLPKAQTHLWVDSSVVLAWIQGHPSRWQEFIANRVALIQELTPTSRWHHVAGIDNPADCASRGLSPDLMADHKLWWTGPPWLSQPSTACPSLIPPINPGQNLEERAAPSKATTVQRSPTWDLVHRYSKLSRLLRITAWVLRAVDYFKNPTASKKASLTPSEILEAENLWIKRTQSEGFTCELKSLSRGAAIPRSHPLLRLAPFIDNQGLLRVGGRLRNSQLDPDAKHPILLPRDSQFSNLVIDDVHSRTLHGGTQLMLAVLRQRYWILGGRAPVNSFVRRCERCARYRAVAAQELMGQLPTTRVTPARPFLHAGVDYAGPFTLKTWHGRSSRTYKGFLVLFICFATSAVHLELATDYSTQGFIAAFKRFTGRRGICASLTSDRVTNFVGADAELRRMLDAASREHSEIANILASNGTDWRFNPPAAPHFGGKWEAAVKSTKYHLRRLIGDASLTYEEFSTLLIQIEAILNSRPLCPLSDDPSDVEALTPSHFLIGSSLAMIPEPSLEDVPTTRLSRWQRLRQITDQFWHRWSREYLQRLQDIAKWRHPSRQLKIGSLVLLMDDRFPPSKWPLGRVTETHSGADGLIRVVTVRTADSIFKRPIVKLCPLPISD